MTMLRAGGLLDVLTSLSDSRQETVEKIMERRISGVSYMCRIDFHNGIWGCGLLCTLLISFYFLPLFHSSISPATTPRATTPHLYRTGHHAFTTTAQLSRLCISRLPRQGLPRPIFITTCYHTRQSSSYFIVYLSPAFTPPLHHLDHHRRHTLQPTQHSNHLESVRYLLYIVRLMPKNNSLIK